MAEKRKKAVIAPPAGGPPPGPPPGMDDMPALFPSGPIPKTREAAGPEPVIDEALITDAGEADVIIVGFGQGGVQTALAAVEGGASVIALESKKADRMRWWGEQIATYNSKFLEKHGFGPYDLDEIVREYTRCGGYLVNPDVINLFVKNSGEMLDHLVEIIGEDSDILAPGQWNVHEAYGKPEYPVIIGGSKCWAGTIEFRGSLIHERGARVMINGNSRLPEVVKKCVERAESLGAQVEYDRKGVVLTHEGERVTGVIAQDAQGKYYRYTAKKALVLATGDPGNKCMNMGLWAGGVIEDTPQAGGMFTVSGPFGMSSAPLFNARGERFCDESIAYGLTYAVSRQPKGLVSAIYDKKWLKQLQNTNIHHSSPDFGMPEYFEQIAEDMQAAADSMTQPYKVRSAAASEREMADVYSADTLEELGEMLGYEGEALQCFLSSVARYNEMCYKAHDDDYGKDARCLIPLDEAPFYGIRGRSDHRAPNSAPGFGFMVDKNLQIQNADGWPIPGLYAAGICVGGRHALFYPTPSGGNYIGFAATLGRVLGKKLAEL